MSRDAGRPIPLVLTTVIAAFAATVTLAVSGGHGAHAHDAAAHAAGGEGAAHAVAGGDVSARELALRLEMRKLWEDHITWTRLAIISLTTDAPDTEATVGRLLQNQRDIGQGLGAFYGRAAGRHVTRELRAHILIAADVIAAARAGDAPALADAQARWVRNADRIARLLHALNPRYWGLHEMRTMLHEHLMLTTQEAVARLQADWAADVRAYDEIHRQALGMADMLSDGLVAQFPRRF